MRNSRVWQNPHPTPLPAYRESGQEKARSSIEDVSLPFTEVLRARAHGGAAVGTDRQKSSGNRANRFWNPPTFRPAPLRACAHGRAARELWRLRPTRPPLTISHLPRLRRRKYIPVGGSALWVCTSPAARRLGGG